MFSEDKLVTFSIDMQIPELTRGDVHGIEYKAQYINSALQGVIDETATYRSREGAHRKCFV